MNGFFLKKREFSQQNLRMGVSREGKRKAKRVDPQVNPFSEDIGFCGVVERFI